MDPIHKTSLIKLSVIVGVLSAGVLALWLFGDSTQPAKPSLCSLLHDGWTVNELTHNDRWRAWTEHQSMFEREMAVTREASAHCPNLISL